MNDERPSKQQSNKRKLRNEREKVDIFFCAEEMMPMMPKTS
jgi:hypothetical protein